MPIQRRHLLQDVGSKIGARSQRDPFARRRMTWTSLELKPCRSAADRKINSGGQGGSAMNIMSASAAAEPMPNERPEVVDGFGHGDNSAGRDTPCRRSRSAMWAVNATRPARL